METTNKKVITVETKIKAPIEKVWELWNDPKHITQWYNASDDWHAPYAENDLRIDGKFKTKMAARDGSAGFDFEGVYSKIVDQKIIEYSIADGRKVSIVFSEEGDHTTVAETFETENEYTPELQRSGWQTILDNFKKHAEAS